MSGFITFSIVLTIAYIIYYAVMLSRDLYGKENDVNTNEEVIDIGHMKEEYQEEELAISVAESETGFNIADKSYETASSGVTTSNISNEENPTESPNTEASLKKSASEILSEKVADKLEDTNFFMLDQKMQDEFTLDLLTGRGSNLGKPEIACTLINDNI